MPTRIRRRDRGTTIEEVLVVISIVALLVLLLPSASTSARRDANQMACANNLRQLGTAAMSYAQGPYGPGRRPGWLPHIRGRKSDDEPEDVGKVFAMLVKIGALDTAEIFVCPSSMTDFAPKVREQRRFAFTDTDVGSSREFSYGWTKKQLSQSAASTALLAADRASGPQQDDVGNHGDGRNVLRKDGSVEFYTTFREAEREVGKALATLNLIKKKKGKKKKGGK